MYLVGTDEAGYGPNLGPLLIAATVWRLPDQRWVERRRRADIDLYRRLKGVVTAELPGDGIDRRVAIADSKALYQPGKGLAALERGVLTALSALGPRPTTCRALWDWLDADMARHRELLPWPADFDGDVPLETDRDELDAAAEEFADGLNAAGVQLVAMRGIVVFPQQFNDLRTQYGNKAEALSRLTLGLVADVLAPLPDAPVLVCCDKHGGRNFYRRLLQEQFPDILIEVCGEGQQNSIYRLGTAERRVEIQFRVGCEEMLPTALASMTAKYFRELSMRAFNDFWCARVPDLRPTAGYPGDSRRFKQAIAAVQAELAIEDHVLWRAR
jgi:hypothetical protein